MGRVFQTGIVEVTACKGSLLLPLFTLLQLQPRGRGWQSVQDALLLPPGFAFLSLPWLVSLPVILPVSLLPSLSPSILPSSLSTSSSSMAVGTPPGHRGSSLPLLGSACPLLQHLSKISFLLSLCNEQVQPLLAAYYIELRVLFVSHCQPGPGTSTDTSLIMCH